MKVKTKAIFWVLIAIFALAFMGTSVWAQEKYPSKPITMLCGYAAGGVTDVVARALAESAKKALDVPVVVVNKPGGQSIIAMEAARIAKPDGYTIVLTATSPLAAIRLGHAKFDFFDDFTPICHVTKWLIGFAVSASSPWKTFEEFRQYAKAHPGELKYGASGIGSVAPLSTEDLAYRAGIKIVQVPIDSESQSVAALLGGHIQAAAVSWYGYGENVKAGKMRLLVTYTDERIPELPDVPTGRELGFRVNTKGPVGVVGPKGLPENVVKTLAEAFKKATEDAQFIQVMKNIHSPIMYKDPKAYWQECRDYDEWSAEIMRRTGLIK